MKSYFIFNPVAGTKEKRDRFLVEINKIMEINKDVSLITTKEVGEATTIAKTIASSGEEVNIFACGGDGTTNEVLNGIVGFDNVNLGIMATGSCNDFLKSFENIDPWDFDLQLTSKPIKLDIMKVNDLYSLNVTNIGYDARVNYEQECLRPKYKTVKQAYRKAIINNLLRKLGDRVTIKLDDKDFYDAKSLLIACANGKYYGNGLHIGPKCDLNDGMLDLTVIKKVSVLTFLLLFGKFKKGLVYGNPKYERVSACGRGKKIDIISPDTLCACLDGQTVHCKELHIETIHNGINFILPVKK